MRKINKKAAAVALGVVALTGTGVAYAYWTTSGSGTGSAEAQSATAASTLTSQLSSVVGAGIFPGGAVDVAYFAVNPSATDLFVTKIVPTVTTSNTTTCKPEWFTLSGLASDGSITVNKNIPAHTTATNKVTLTSNRLSLANAVDAQGAGVDQDGCKGATITVNLTSS